MKRKAACDFLKRLAQQLSAFKELIAMPENKGEDPQALAKFMGAFLPKITEVIANVEDLSGFLIMNSTGLKQEELDDLDFVDSLELLRIALDLNTGDELKNCLAGIAANLRGLTKTPTKSGANSTLTS